MYQTTLKNVLIDQIGAMPDDIWYFNGAIYRLNADGRVEESFGNGSWRELDNYDGETLSGMIAYPEEVHILRKRSSIEKNCRCALSKLLGVWPGEEWRFGLDTYRVGFSGLLERKTKYNNGETGWVPEESADWVQLVLENPNQIVRGGQ